MSRKRPSRYIRKSGVLQAIDGRVTKSVTTTKWNISEYSERQDYEGIRAEHSLALGKRMMAIVVTKRSTIFRLLYFSRRWEGEERCDSLLFFKSLWWNTTGHTREKHITRITQLTTHSRRLTASQQNTETRISHPHPLQKCNLLSEWASVCTLLLHDPFYYLFGKCNSSIEGGKELRRGWQLKPFFKQRRKSKRPKKGKSSLNIHNTSKCTQNMRDNMSDRYSHLSSHSFYSWRVGMNELWTSICQMKNFSRTLPFGNHQNESRVKANFNEFQRETSSLPFQKWRVQLKFSLCERMHEEVTLMKFQIPVSHEWAGESRSRWKIQYAYGV